MVEKSDAAPTGLKGFGLAVRKKVYDNSVGVIAAAIVAVAVTVALVVWNPVKTVVENQLTDRKNISTAEAFKEARRAVGSRTVFAVPFRNRDDNIQYIAVWNETDGKNDPCDSEGTDVPDWCALQLGPVAVDILVGNDDTYERIPTHITAGTQAGGIGGDPAAIAKAAGLPIQRQWGIVDRDGDGKKEILSIADSTGTSPTLPVYVSLYDTGSGKVLQLRSYPSRFSVRNEFQGVVSGSDRAWLIARLKEFNAQSGDLCRREPAGALSCTESAAYKQTMAEDKAMEAEHGGDYEWMEDSNGDWVDNNGVDFTQGRITLSWKQGRLDPGDDCTGRTGRYEWVNVFKGPLVVNDLVGHRRAVAYLQDGDHHREIPRIIFGKRYVWLALVAEKEILAIDPSTFELKRFDVPEFADGIPQEWAEEGKPHEMVPHKELTATKDFQLDGLFVENGHLVYADEALSVPVSTDEFVGARQCPA